MSTLQMHGRHGFDLDTALAAVERRMSALCGAETGAAEPVALAAADHLAAGGKRIRARLALDASRRVGVGQADAVAVAAVVELLHNASLVHDDLQDRDAWRRGAPAVWQAYGDGVAVCVGDLMISGAYSALAGLSDPSVVPGLLDQVHAAVSVCVRGQHRDLQAQRRPVTRFPEYESIAAGKSGPLLGLALTLPLMASGAHAAARDAEVAAKHFAIGFQIADDLADVAADSGAVGKSPGLNAVLVLQSSAPLAEATAEAAARALVHLDQAIEVSDALPHACARLCVALARQLKQQIGTRARRTAGVRRPARTEGLAAC